MPSAHSHTVAAVLTPLFKWYAPQWYKFQNAFEMNNSILRLPEVILRTKLSKSAIYDKLDSSSPRFDPSFPKQVKTGSRSVGWYEQELSIWLESLKYSRDAQQPPHNDAEKGITSPVQEEVKSQSGLNPVNNTQAFGNRANHAVQLVPFVNELISGQKINDDIMKYLLMPAWTPAIAALLACGIKPAPDCKEIPSKAYGFDGKLLDSHSPRLREAKDILAMLTYDDDAYIDIDVVELIDGKEILKTYLTARKKRSPSDVGGPLEKVKAPGDFLIRFIEDDIRTPWITIIENVINKTVPTDALSKSQLALSMSAFSPDEQKQSLQINSDEFVTKARTKTGELSETRNTRILERVSFLRKSGCNNFIKTVAEEEKISISRVKQILDK